MGKLFNLDFFDSLESVFEGVLEGVDEGNTLGIDDGLADGAALGMDEGIADLYPPARKCHSVVQDGCFAYVIGGYHENNIFDDIWRLDLSTMRWTIMPCRLAKKVYFHSSVIYDGEIITFGGVHDKVIVDADDNITEEVRINAIQTCHVRICSLQQICWRAINYYCQDLVKQSDDVLMEEGIPVNLIQQLKA